MFYQHGGETSDSNVMRLGMHALGGGFVITMMMATYYSLMPFIADSQQASAPASIFGWCMMLPMTLGVLYLWNINVLKDTILSEIEKLAFLMIELIGCIVIIALSAQNPVFGCSVVACTYDVLPPVQYLDQTVQTWDPMAGKAVTALLYFTLGIAMLPCILWHIWNKILVIQNMDKRTKSSSIDEGSDQGRSSIAIASQDNPMMMGSPHIEMTSIQHKNTTTNAPLPQSIGSSVISENDMCGSVTKHREQIENRRWWQWVSILACLLLLWPAHYFCTSRFGNDFQWFSDYGNAAWAKHIIHPDIPQITINKLLNYKFFPQIIIFYLWVYGIVAIALIAKVSPVVRRFFAWRPVSFEKLSILDRCTMGEFLFAFFFGVFQFATFAYTFWNWYGIPHPKWRGAPQMERWGRCLGQTSMFAMGGMVLPISRNSVWAKLLDYPWDGMIKFHKWMSITFILISTGHMIAFWLCFNSLNEFPAALFSSPNSYRKEDSTIGMMSGMIFFVLIPVFCVLTWNYVRRKQFELFYYAHFLSSAIFLATLWHADFAWMYMIPGLAMYLWDHMIRFTDAVKNYEVVALEACGDDVVTLSFGIKSSISGKIENLTFESGQYVFVNIPDISPLQSHPFNISGSMYDSSTVLHIKSCGQNTWTGQLLEMAKMIKKENEKAKRTSGKLFQLNRLGIGIDGPYGLPFPYARCTSILLVGGGIGVTPLHSILRSLLHLSRTNKGISKESVLRKVKLVWTFRNSKLITENAVFRDTLSLMMESTATSSVQDFPSTPLLNSDAPVLNSSTPLSRERTPIASHGSPPVNSSPSPKSKSQVAPAGVCGTPIYVETTEGGEPEDDGRTESTEEASHAQRTPNYSPNPKSRSQVAPAGVIGTALYIDTDNGSIENEDLTDDECVLETREKVKKSVPPAVSTSEEERRRRLEANGFGESLSTPTNGTPMPRRGSAAAEATQSTMRIQLGDILFEVELFCTAVKTDKTMQQSGVTTLDMNDIEGGESSNFTFPVKNGRPNLVNEVSALSGAADSLCFCVGPDSLVSKTREVCSDLCVEFRGENAEL